MASLFADEDEDTFLRDLDSIPLPLFLEAEASPSLPTPLSPFSSTEFDEFAALCDLTHSDLFYPPLPPLPPVSPPSSAPVPVPAPVPAPAEELSTGTELPSKTDADRPEQIQLYSTPVATAPEGNALSAVGMWNGQLVYFLPTTSTTRPKAAPQVLKTAARKLPKSAPKERRRTAPEDDGKAYVKKPPNAFMLFLRDQRDSVPEEVKKNGNGTVNKHLGQTWKSMTATEQAKYYEQAKQEAKIHKTENPYWSCKDNYGKRRKRSRAA